MIRLFAIMNANSPSVQHYRSRGTFPWLHKETNGQIVVERHEMRDFNPADLVAADVVFMDRPVEPHALGVIQAAKLRGKKVWVDFDDYIWDIPRGNNARPYYLDQNNMKMVEKAITSADVVTVTTPYLQKAYSQLNPNTVVIPNCWDDYCFPENEWHEVESQHSPARIAWRGSNSHNADIYHARGVIAEILRHPQHFDFKQFGGDDPHFIEGFDPATQMVPWSDLFVFWRRFFSAGIDYVFFPLIDHPFNKGKSNIVWIEAAIAGAVVIAPQHAPAFDVPGVIRYKDNQHAKKVFQDIKAGKYDKVDLVSKAREYLKQHYRLTEINRLRFSVALQLMGVNIAQDNGKTENAKAEQPKPAVDKQRTTRQAAKVNQ